MHVCGAFPFTRPWDTKGYNPLATKDAYMWYVYVAFHSHDLGTQRVNPLPANDAYIHVCVWITLFFHISL